MGNGTLEALLARCSACWSKTIQFLIYRFDHSFGRRITGIVPLFRNKFPGLFQDSDWFFKASKIYINPCTPKISMLILVTAFHTLQIFQRSLTDFQTFPGPVTFFQDFPVLENAIIKFQDFPGFPGPVRTLELYLMLRVRKLATGLHRFLRKRTLFYRQVMAKM